MEQALFFIMIFLNRFPVQLALCETLFCLYLPKRKHWKIALLLYIPYSLILSGWTPLVHWMTLIDFGSFEPFVRPTFFLIFVISIIIMFLLYNIPFEEILFLGMGGYILQHLITNISEILGILFSEKSTFKGVSTPGTGINYYISRQIIIIFILFLSWLFFVRKYRELYLYHIRKTYLFIFISCAFFIINLVSTWLDFQNLLNLGTAFFASFCCILLLIIQFELFERYRMIIEQEISRKLMQQQTNLYEQAMQNTELINQKAHDLKHIMLRMRALDTSNEFTDEWNDIEAAVGSHQSFLHTGNEALDLVLSSKSTTCRNEQITFSVIANGNAISFMKSSDIYILFGNILDNAIEYEKSITEPAKRIIDLHIENFGKLVRISATNFCEKNLTIKNGLPVTTKADTLTHGFGLRSVKQIVNKYNGTMDIQTQNNQFQLTLIFY